MTKQHSLIFALLLVGCGSSHKDVSWRPMDSAPHDGTVIEILCGIHEGSLWSGPWYWTTVDYSKTEDWRRLIKQGVTEREMGNPIVTAFHHWPDKNGTLIGGPLPNCRWHPY